MLCISQTLYLTSDTTIYRKKHISTLMCQSFYKSRHPYLHMKLDENYYLLGMVYNIIVHNIMPPNNNGSKIIIMKLSN